MATETDDTKGETNPLALSDEDFLNMGAPPAPEGAGEGADTQTATDLATGGEDTSTAQDGNDTLSGQDTGTGSDTVAGSGGDTLAGSGGADSLAAGGGADTLAGAAGADDTKPADAKAGDKVGGEAGKDSIPDYEGFYKQIMAPFKANGKTVELRSPEEAIQLMQMGANYTRKMQELVPHRKVMTMLQNNGLLDEGKLSFLIDLDKKNPEAIKKLLKDSGIDPLEIDTAAEPAYLPGNHQVTDEEVNFRSALEELSSAPTGQETLQNINNHWDDASKELLWKHPETFAIIHSQREVGIYDRIVAEIDRRKTLGSIPATTPFLQAYKVVGDELSAADSFADLREKFQGTAPGSQAATPPGQVETGAEPQPVATRAAAPKPQVKNDDRASAASPTRSTPQKAQVFENPLAMSDADFLKQMEGRL